MKDPRTRLVNFRVSEEEYRKIQEFAQSSNARSMSEFARTQILKGLEQQSISAATQANQITNSEIIRKISAEVEKIKFHLDID